LLEKGGVVLLILMAVLEKVSNKLHALAVFLLYSLNRMGSVSEPVWNIWRKALKI
jgi:hypothetical protein